MARVQPQRTNCASRWVLLPLLCISHGGALHAQSDTAGSVSAAPSFEVMNTLLGLPLWQDDCLWDDQPRDVGARLEWPEESRTRFLAIYRHYPPPETRVLGRRPYSMALYAENGRPTRLSLFFTNKGDFEGFLGDLGRKSAQREALKIFENALRADAEAIEAALRAKLGEPQRETIGEQRLRERVFRWDWRGHAFLLSEQDREYVALRVWPSELADARGRAEKTSDAVIRRALAERVIRRDNGDVVVGDIPMITQGPKGYCVPATWERYLLYLGVPADMYALAMAGDTGDGGTIAELMRARVNSLVRRYQRSVRDFSGRVNIPRLANYLDAGVPIMWVMQIEPNLNHQLTDRARLRARMNDREEWKNRLAPFRRSASDLRRRLSKDNAHMCLIIGYNPHTNELAISDSWGPEFAERWITVEEAEAISLGQFMVVAW